MMIVQIVSEIPFKSIVRLKPVVISTLFPTTNDKQNPYVLGKTATQQKVAVIVRIFGLSLWCFYCSLNKYVDVIELACSVRTGKILVEFLFLQRFGKEYHRLEKKEQDQYFPSLDRTILLFIPDQLA